MPFPKILLKKKLWIGVVGALLLIGIYVYAQFMKVRVAMTSRDIIAHLYAKALPQPQEADVTPNPLPVFHWLPVANTTSLSSCRNSRQGYSVVVDELGKIAC